MPRMQVAIDQVARNDDEVGLLRIRPLDCRFHPRRMEKPADVQVGQVDYAIAVEFFRQASDWKFDLLCRWNADGLAHAEGGEGNCDHAACVANQCRYEYVATPKCRKGQRCQVRQQLKRRKQKDDPGNPVRCDHDLPRHLGREHRAENQKADQTVLEYNHQEDCGDNLPSLRPG
ncbi:hypothetical protein ACTJKE_07100 [Ensifer sp. 22521]|uniref:hypothetical protein n=1 Tax=Ensifer sp. 22521 TaxID=3453935 RepID=UPI003F842C77